jgi:hypothetical protein
MTTLPELTLDDLLEIITLYPDLNAQIHYKKIQKLYDLILDIKHEVAAGTATAETLATKVALFVAALQAWDATHRRRYIQSLETRLHKLREAVEPVASKTKKNVFLYNEPVVPTPKGDPEYEIEWLDYLVETFQEKPVAPAPELAAAPSPETDPNPLYIWCSIIYWAVCLLIFYFYTPITADWLLLGVLAVTVLVAKGWNDFDDTSFDCSTLLLNCKFVPLLQL